MIWSTEDLCDMIMQGKDIWNLPGVLVDQQIDLASLCEVAAHDAPALRSWAHAGAEILDAVEYDSQQQRQWLMPDHYRDIDIAALVLDRCTTQDQLQRAGQELLMYQQRDMMDLLRYLHYLVETMRTAGVVWGVGRGSSVASYVLYVLGVHKVDSLFYDLDPAEFLR